MEGLVEHYIRQPWNSDPDQGESYHDWGLRMDAIYDTHEAALDQWINQPLLARPSPEWGEQEANPPRSAALRGWASPYEPEGQGSAYRKKDASDQHGWIPTAGTTTTLALGGRKETGATRRATTTRTEARGNKELPENPKVRMRPQEKHSLTIHGAA